MQHINKEEQESNDEKIPGNVVKLITITRKYYFGIKFIKYLKSIKSTKLAKSIKQRNRLLIVRSEYD